LDRSALESLVDHPSVAAVKYALPDLTEAASTLTDRRMAGKVSWICGLAETWLLPFSVFGISGVTSGMANVNPVLAVRTWTSLRDGDWDLFQQHMSTVARFEALRTRDSGRHNVAVIKSALEMLGLCEKGLRAPCVPLDPASEEQVRGIVAEWRASGALEDDLAVSGTGSGARKRGGQSDGNGEAQPRLDPVGKGQRAP
jgi:4-hydroxy-tetrahydrodipicolinate synthase